MALKADPCTCERGTSWPSGASLLSLVSNHSCSHGSTVVRDTVVRDAWFDVTSALVRSISTRRMHCYCGPSQVPFSDNIELQRSGEGSPFKMQSVNIHADDQVHPTLAWVSVLLLLLLSFSPHRKIRSFWTEDIVRPCKRTATNLSPTC